MIEDTNVQIDEPNRWRLETPGHQGMEAHGAARRPESLPDDLG